MNYANITGISRRVSSLATWQRFSPHGHIIFHRLRGGRVPLRIPDSTIFLVTQMLGINVILRGIATCCTTVMQNFPGVTAVRTDYTAWNVHRLSVLYETTGRDADGNMVPLAFESWRVMFVSVGRWYRHDHLAAQRHRRGQVPQRPREKTDRRVHHQISVEQWQKGLSAPGHPRGGSPPASLASLPQQHRSSRHPLGHRSNILCHVGRRVRVQAQEGRPRQHVLGDGVLLSHAPGNACDPAQIPPVARHHPASGSGANPARARTHVVLLRVASRSPSLAGIYLINLDVGPLPSVPIYRDTPKLKSQSTPPSLRVFIGPPTFQKEDAPRYLAAKITVFGICEGAAIVTTLLRVLQGWRHRQT